MDVAAFAFAVTPSDANALATPASFGLFVGGAGNVTVKDYAGRSVTFTGVPAGTHLKVFATFVMATGTTATNIVAMA